MCACVCACVHAWAQVDICVYGTKLFLCMHALCHEDVPRRSRTDMLTLTCLLMCQECSVHAVSWNNRLETCSINAGIDLLVKQRSTRGDRLDTYDIRTYMHMYNPFVTYIQCFNCWTFPMYSLTSVTSQNSHTQPHSLFSKRLCMSDYVWSIINNCARWRIVQQCIYSINEM